VLNPATEQANQLRGFFLRNGNAVNPVTGERDILYRRPLVSGCF
jgi:hypothetical protein